MTASQSKTVFWLSMLIAQCAAFIIFKDLADISQWLVQSTREFTMGVWYNRHLISIIGFAALFLAIFIWLKDRQTCSSLILTALIFFFVFNFYSGMINPKWMFR